MFQKLRQRYLDWGKSLRPLTLFHLQMHFNTSAADNYGKREIDYHVFSLITTLSFIDIFPYFGIVIFKVVCCRCAINGKGLKYSLLHLSMKRRTGFDF